jgi:hypothetical protein
MSLCRLERDGVPVTYSRAGSQPYIGSRTYWDNVPCLRSMPAITLPNAPGIAVFIKMMLFDPEVGLSIKVGECDRKAGRGREINESYSETKENWTWGMLPGDQRRHLTPERG